jgi:hypothetical protein
VADADLVVVSVESALGGRPVDGVVAWADAAGGPVCVAAGLHRAPEAGFTDRLRRWASGVGHCHRAAVVGFTRRAPETVWPVLEDCAAALGGLGAAADVLVCDGDRVSCGPGEPMVPLAGFADRRDAAGGALWAAASERVGAVPADGRPQLVRDVLAACLSSPSPDRADLAALAVLAGDEAVRGAARASWDRSTAGRHADVWFAAAASCPRSEQAAPLAMAGLADWVSGGTAYRAVDEALRGRPGGAAEDVVKLLGLVCSKRLPAEVWDRARRGPVEESVTANLARQQPAPERSAFAVGR